MADKSGSARFEALFESALQDYDRTTGVTLARHPLAVDIQNCQSVDNISTLLQRRAEAFSDFRQKDRMTKAIKNTLSILTPLSDVASLAGTVGLRTKVHPHMLRHTFVTSYAGVDLRDVQIAARHADPRTTMRYDRPVRTWTGTRTTPMATHIEALSAAMSNSHNIL